MALAAGGMVNSVLLGLGGAGESRLAETGKPTGEMAVSFERQLQNALGYVNDLQLQAAQNSAELVMGDLESLHRLLIDAEKARLALQLTVQVTNKAVEAYQEISRMQI